MSRVTIPGLALRTILRVRRVTPVDVDSREGEFTVRGGKTVVEGVVISIDGSTGEVFDGAVPVTPSHAVRYSEDVEEPSVQAAARIIEHADTRRRLKVRTNADTVEGARRTRRFGAHGNWPAPVVTGGRCRNHSSITGSQTSVAP